jgi:hypothetical protein
VPAAARKDVTQRISCNCHQSVTTILHPPSTPQAKPRCHPPPWQSLQATPRCHWPHRPSLAHAAHAGPVALASFGKAARGSVAGPELRRRKLHAIGPMPSPPTGVFRRDVQQAAPLTNRTAMDAMPFHALLSFTVLVYDVLTCADRGTRLFVGSVALGITDAGTLG